MIKKAKYSPSPSFLAFLGTSTKQVKDALNLNDYRVIFTFVDVIEAYTHIPSEGGYTFEIEVDLIYMEVEVSVARKAEEYFNEGKSTALLEDLCHELSHVITDPITDYAREKERDEVKLCNLNENLTQKIAVIAMKSLI